jgi:uncharacterized membrane protein YagU involved in acid resistance
MQVDQMISQTAMANSTQAGIVGSPSAHPRAFPAIVVGGLIVGAMDLVYAIAVYSPRDPILIPQTIASGILGAKSYSEGTYSLTLGIVLQFVIALGAATVYYLASRRLKFLVSHAVACGLTYGALVYLFMHVVVLPLSAVPKGDTPLVYMALEFVEHWLCVGLPIALSVRHYSR